MFVFIPQYAIDSPPFPEPVLAVVSEITQEEIEPKKVDVKNPYLKFAKLLAAVGIFFLLLSYGPSVVFYILGSEKISGLLNQTAMGAATNVAVPDNYQPAFNKELPQENTLIIKSAGIKTVIEESASEYHEEALRRGVWRVNDFGTPYTRELPTILTAHRYGYLAWSLNFRLHNSFFNLPKVKEGDTIEIVWRQRKYVYAVYKTETGKEISDYSADLILYTCQDLNSDIRIFAYAKLLKI